jgi:prevent-host-death family protein
MMLESRADFGSRLAHFVLDHCLLFWTVFRFRLERTAVQISVTDAKAKLTELVRRAEADEEIILTRHGQPVVRLVPDVAARSRRARLATLKMLRQANHTQVLIADGLPGMIARRHR